MFFTQESFSLMGINSSRYNATSGHHVIARESADEMLGIIYTMCECDIKEASGRYTTEGFFTDVYKKIKDFLKKLWEKIKSFFKNLMMLINSIYMDGKDFYSKYKSELDKKSSVKVSIVDFKYTHLDIKKIEDIDKDFGNIITELDNYSKETEKLANKISGDKDIDNITTEAIDKSKKKIDDMIISLTSANKNNAFDKYFRNGKSEESSVEWTVSDAIKIVSMSNPSSNLDKFSSDLEKIKNSVNKTVDKCENVVNKFSDDDKTAKKNASRLTAEVREVVSSFSKISTIYDSAVKATSDAYKSAIKSSKKVFYKALKQKNI